MHGFQSHGLTGACGDCQNPLKIGTDLLIHKGDVGVVTLQ